MGFLGSLGFVALGAALGLSPSFIAVLSKPSEAAPITNADVATVGVFVGSAVMAVVCLFVAGIDLWRNSRLADKIRKRTKHGIGASVSNAENA